MVGGYLKSNRILLYLAGLVVFLSLLAFFIFFRSSTGFFVGSSGDNVSVKIGVLAPLTGPLSAQGQWMKEGLELAKQELEQKNIFVELIYEDDKCNPLEAVNGAKKLLDLDKVDAIIGPYCSGPTLAVAPLVEKQKTVLITPTASSPNIRVAGDFVFRNIVTTEQYANDLASFAALRLGLKSAAIVSVNDEYGVTFAKYFKDNFEKYGGVIVENQTFVRGDIDFRAQLSKVRSSSPQAIFFAGGSAKENGWLLKQSKELGIKAIFLTEWTSENPELFETATSAAQGVYLVSPFNPNSKNWLVEEFQKTYFGKYGRLAEGTAAHSFDALLILSNALVKCDKNSDCTKSGIYGTQNYSGVTGLTSFDKDGEVLKSTILKVSNENQFVPVDED